MSGRARVPGTWRAGTARAEAALGAVRAHLLHAATAEAERIRATARAEAAALLRQARADAEHAVGLAAAHGRADAGHAAAAERSRARLRARSIVLGAQHEAYEELCRQVRAETAGLRDEPGYRLLLARLTSLATRAAGHGATVSYPAAGGVLAQSGQVTVDCSLPRLAAQAVLALGDQVRDLWEQ